MPDYIVAYYDVDCLCTQQLAAPAAPAGAYRRREVRVLFAANAIARLAELALVQIHQLIV